MCVDKPARSPLACDLEPVVSLCQSFHKYSRSLNRLVSFEDAVGAQLLLISVSLWQNWFRCMSFCLKLQNLLMTLSEDLSVNAGRLSDNQMRKWWIWESVIKIIISYRVFNANILSVWKELLTALHIYLKIVIMLTLFPRRNFFSKTILYSWKGLIKWLSEICSSVTSFEP